MDDKPDLKTYDLLIINSSSGKDSQSALDVVCCAAATLGILDRVHVVHAVLEEEWEGTVELVSAQAAHYGVPVHYVKRSQGSLLDHIRRRGKWPSSQARYCTSDHKRAQVSKLITALARQHPHPRPRILNCLGIRAAESPARAKKQPFALDARQTNGRKHVDIWYPIFYWSLEQVWETIRKAGTPVHPAYALGMPRLSCCFCVFAPKSALILAGKHNRALLERYVEVERAIGHQFRNDLAIADILSAVERGEAPGEIRSWEL
jgi:3'-phosphoadenosine 5'-phosphosulfate sulfotransferase (PAPS reductase)/FAD synthetase